MQFVINMCCAGRTDYWSLSALSFCRAATNQVWQWLRIQQELYSILCILKLSEVK